MNCYLRIKEADFYTSSSLASSSNDSIDTLLFLHGYLTLLILWNTNAIYFSIVDGKIE